MLCIVFGLSLLDRTNISAAYIAGLAADLKLTINNRYNIALLVFFIGAYQRAFGRMYKDLLVYFRLLLV